MEKAGDQGFCMSWMNELARSAEARVSDAARDTRAAVEVRSREAATARF